MLEAQLNDSELTSEAESLRSVRIMMENGRDDQDDVWLHRFSIVI